MEKISKKTKKSPKIKKRQPLKVVYITNPIKFETSALEFRSLVQELTGQYADVAYSAGTGFSEGDSGGEPVKATEEDNVHAASEEEEVTKSGKLSGGVDETEESDPTAVDKAFVSSLMIDGLGSNLFDILKNLDAM